MFSGPSAPAAPALLFTKETAAGASPEPMRRNAVLALTLGVCAAVTSVYLVARIVTPGLDALISPENSQVGRDEQPPPRHGIPSFLPIHLVAQHHAVPGKRSFWIAPTFPPTSSPTLRQGQRPNAGNAVLCSKPWMKHETFCAGQTPAARREAAIATAIQAISSAKHLSARRVLFIELLKVINRRVHDQVGAVPAV